MDRNLKCDFHWKAVEQYWTAVLFAFQFYLVCSFGKYVNVGFGTVGSEIIKVSARVQRANFRNLNISPIKRLLLLQDDPSLVTINTPNENFLKLSVRF